MSGIYINEEISIPEHELEISASRAGGPGGQHVNKTSSRITVRWSVHTSTALTYDQKERIAHQLASRISNDGFLQISNSATRSQVENRKRAIAQLAYLVAKALVIPKKRTATQISKGTHEKRLQKKSKRGEVKQLRRRPQGDD